MVYEFRKPPGFSHHSDCRNPCSSFGRAGSIRLEADDRRTCLWGFNRLYRFDSAGCNVPLCVTVFESSGRILDDVGLHEFAFDAPSDVHRHTHFLADRTRLHGLGI